VKPVDIHWRRLAARTAPSARGIRIVSTQGTIEVYETSVRTYVRSVYRGSTLKQLALRQFMTDAVKAASKKPKLWRGASAATPFLTILPTFPLLVYVCRCLSAKPTGVHVGYTRDDRM